MYQLSKSLEIIKMSVNPVLNCVQDEQRKDSLKKNLLLLVLHYLTEEG